MSLLHTHACTHQALNVIGRRGADYIEDNIQLVSVIRVRSGVFHTEGETAFSREKGTSLLPRISRH